MDVKNGPKTLKNGQKWPTNMGFYISNLTQSKLMELARRGFAVTYDGQLLVSHWASGSVEGLYLSKGFVFRETRAGCTRGVWGRLSELGMIP